MGKCSMCKLFGHAKPAHRQVCAICGGGEVYLDRATDVDPNWKCDDVAAHERIRLGFGDPALVQRAKTSPAAERASHEKALKGQQKLGTVH